MQSFYERRKKTDGLTVFFALLGSGRAKSACKMLMKLTLVTISST
jgi:hypothetical protein